MREGNFALDGLLGCKLMGNDIAPNPACEALGMTYVSREEIFARSDILSLHCPLTPDTHHMIPGHQAFFTEEALVNIAQTTIANITAFAEHGQALHEVSIEKIAHKA